MGRKGREGEGELEGNESRPRAPAKASFYLVGSVAGVQMPLSGVFCQPVHFIDIQPFSHSLTAPYASRIFVTHSHIRPFSPAYHRTRECNIPVHNLSTSLAASRQVTVCARTLSSPIHCHLSSWQIGACFHPTVGGAIYTQPSSGSTVHVVGGYTVAFRRVCAPTAISAIESRSPIRLNIRTDRACALCHCTARNGAQSGPPPVGARHRSEDQSPYPQATKFTIVYA